MAVFGADVADAYSAFYDRITDILVLADFNSLDFSGTYPLSYDKICEVGKRYRAESA